jgi:hypothetical protein
MDRYDLFKNLVVMAAADKSLTESEIQLLSDRCVEWGITDPQFAHAIEEAIDGDGTQIVLPDSRDECVELLKGLILMMAADGALHPDEKKLFAVTAGRMNFSGDEIDAIIDEALSEA